MEQHLDLLAPDPEVEADPERHYDRVLRLDLSSLEPHLCGPHSPDRVRPISQLKQELQTAANGFVDEVSMELIGSCTNSSYEDMSRAADVAEQARAHGVQARTGLLVTPGSEQVRATIERDGQARSLQAIGAHVLANACGPCIGHWRREAAEAARPITIVTSYNRNFPARNDGQPGTMNFIGSPEMVVALALAGRLSFNPLTDELRGADGNAFKLEAPKRAPEVPQREFIPARHLYIDPPADGTAVALALRPDSERIAPIEPWPAWDGKDFVAMPVLIKTRGKTTTDHISPAGPWLRFRGHLDKFSDNLLLGATNAYTGERGKTCNVLTGQGGQPIAATAREYRAQGVKWIIVGDANYGDGSSREHAALSPRLLGGVAVIARSFARIHESNLKKQGLLALTFVDPADYERIRERDRLNLTGLAGLAPGQLVACRIEHADGTVETIALAHTFSEAQLEWFRRGSALNVMQDVPRSPC
jgi:aconitate hydratase